MQAEGVLELFAELFVAFAGFTGLAGILTRSESDDRLLGQDLRLLVEFSLFYLILSVIPLVLWNGGLAEEIAWRVACGASVLTSACYYALRFESLRSWAVAMGAPGRLWVFTSLDFGFGVALTVAALQLLPLPAAELYVFHLLYGLLGTAASFMRLARPMWESVAS